MPILARLGRIAAAYACACFAAGFVMMLVMAVNSWFDNPAFLASKGVTLASLGEVLVAVVMAILVSAIVGLGTGGFIAAMAAPLSAVAIVLLERRGRPSRRLCAAFGAANGLVVFAVLVGIDGLRGIGLLLAALAMLGGAAAGLVYEKVRYTWFAARPPARPGA